MSTSKKKEKRKTMEPPMCRLCETRHWSNQPHSFETKNKGNSSGKR